MPAIGSTLTSLALAAVAAGLVTTAPVRADEAKGAAKTPWKVSGQLEESCSCDGACPCWFGNHPTKMTCSGGAAYFIDHGKYGEVSLDGLAVADFMQSPAGKTMMESMGNMNFSSIYIDEKATPEQRKALEAVAGEIFAGMAPEARTKVRVTPITRTIDGKEHRVTIGPYV